MDMAMPSKIYIFLTISSALTVLPPGLLTTGQTASSDLTPKGKKAGAQALSKPRGQFQGTQVTAPALGGRRGLKGGTLKGWTSGKHSGLVPPETRPGEIDRGVE